MAEIKKIIFDNENYIKLDGDIESFYKIKDAEQEYPIESLLSDLDGTLIKSEEFWISIIEKTVKRIKSSSFGLGNEDLTFVSGYSTLQHLQYCIDKYCPGFSLNTANEYYHDIAETELKKIQYGEGNLSAFKPREGVGDFLREIKNRGVKIGLATSGLDYKSIPEIISLCKQERLGEPLDFFDSIITGGTRKDNGQYGTIGEIAAKPYPFLYYELAKVGLKQENLHRAIGLEDSSAGVVSLRLAGINVLGFCDGNIIKARFNDLCLKMVNNFENIMNIILN